MDIVKDEERIITNVLNFGTLDASKLLFKVYNLKKIKNVVLHPAPGEWNKKSLNYWSLMLKVTPKISKRKIIFQKTNSQKSEIPLIQQKPSKQGFCMLSETNFSR